MTEAVIWCHVLTTVICNSVVHVNMIDVNRNIEIQFPKHNQDINQRKHIFSCCNKSYTNLQTFGDHLCMHH